MYCKQELHSSRMHNARLLTVSPNMHCDGGFCLARGVSLPGVCLARGRSALPGVCLARGRSALPGGLLPRECLLKNSFDLELCATRYIGHTVTNQRQRIRLILDSNDLIYSWLVSSNSKTYQRSVFIPCINLGFISCFYLVFIPSFYLILTACKRSLGQGNDFTPVCQSFCSWGVWRAP